MGKNKKRLNGVARFLKGAFGQRFFNFTYSIGAAVVILGALFKILHLPWGSELLCIGMITETVMFVLTAFDRPPKEYAWEEVFPVLESKNPEDRPNFGGYVSGGGAAYSGEDGEESEFDESERHHAHYAGPHTYGSAYAPQPAVYPTAQPVVTGEEGGEAMASQGLASAPIVAASLSAEDTLSLRDSIQKMAVAANQISELAELTGATKEYLNGMAGIAEQMNQLKETTVALNNVSSVLLDSYRAITENSEKITGSSSGYVEQMEDLNRNIGGLNTIYEIQLKSISSQLESIDRVNRGLKDIRDMYEKSAHESSHYCEETQKMARYMKQLNQVYEKMITAMTINLYNPMMGGNPGTGGNATQQPNPFRDPSEDVTE